MEPLRGGTLVGKIPDEVMSIWEDTPVQRTPAEWALRWIWNNPHVQVVLSGMNVDEHIAENLRAASDSIPNGMSDEELSVVTFNTKKPAWTSTCTDCGKCEKACPQHIEIRKQFKKVRKDLEGPGMKMTAALVRPLMNRNQNKGDETSS